MADKKVLYISYDGMTDPLGQSQVLPYLTALAGLGYQFTLLSFEKKHRYQKERKMIEAICKKAGINWQPLFFTKKPPILSKIYDRWQMKRKTQKLHRQYQFDMTHCRSYISAEMGLMLKKSAGVKFLFDMRGFWADEKKDGGAWRADHPVFKRVYSYYKRKEAEYLKYADHIISLTDAGKKEMETWTVYNPLIPVTVIPCCADMNHFTLISAEQKLAARKKLSIENDKLVISYLGSIGAWYMLDEMLQLFAIIKKNYSNAFFLFVTHSDETVIRKRANEYAIAAEDMFITEASRTEVPFLLKASDINISFIKPVYSKISSSPTKLGEVLSMGIPVIVNAGVGDVELIIKQTGSGLVLKDFSIQTMEKAVEQIPDLLKLDPGSIREKARNIFDLDKGISLYKTVYHKLLD